ncbi:RagB/SusD family nutrient uptake outer membrane protein [Ohtaekwangia koreensis]|uniref:Starch-binding associating with outer membrane n=1 Tax=Ohtaekwangia koreensis TaxID=688867 RepID=A0A1T5MJX9_9BACT|nr:RagB/SusD family nutrient uptake outer membrane protein [Ohtaekwangia koreensis]SKC88526.1 Starch-binding associating with outer membrane [Ohtaekwangia koreensis]
MKNIHRYSKQSVMRTLVVMAVLLIPLASCDDALETKVYTQVSPENFFKTEADFNVAVVALYSPFSTNWGMADPGDNTWYNSLYNADNKTYLMRSILTTDEMLNGWDPNLENFTFGPSTWSGGNETVYYKIRFVARATDVINKISNATDVSESIRNKYVAEAKVLRAWLMYILYDFFGPVNVKLDPATLNDTEILPRLSDEVYTAQMETDLTEAIPFLAEKYNGNTTEWGRVSQGVARMVLLKLYMHTKQWSKAEAIGKEILSMGYALEDNYADVFTKKGNNELIYAVPSSDATPNYYIQEVLPSDFRQAGNITRKAGGWSGYNMPWSFYDKFEADDERKTAIIDAYTADWGEVDRTDTWWKGPLPLKYTSFTGDGPGYAIDMVVFRLAEVYLSVAEAINEQRGPAEAYTYVNEVRRRSGVADFEDMTEDEFRDAILDERGRELFAEGVRRQDLIRHGKFISGAIARGKDAKPHQVLFPIPSAVIIEGRGIIEQNDGYTN